jgi:hypothetical protein
VLVVATPATAAMVLVGRGCGVAVGGAVGVKVGRRPSVGSGVASDTCAGC